MDPYFLLKIVIFHCYVSSLEGIYFVLEHLAIFSAPPGHGSAEVCHLACQGPLCLLLLLHPSCHASFREVPSHGLGMGVMGE